MSKTKTLKEVKIQQACENTRKQVQMSNTKVIDDFAMYSMKDVDIEINIPNVFGLVDENEIESFKTRIPKALEIFLDYYEYNNKYLDLESAYIIPPDDELINIPFVLSKNQYNKLETIADNYNISIDEAILAIVFIVWNGLKLCDELESGELEKRKVVAHLEPMLETKQLTPFIDEDEIPF